MTTPLLLHSRCKLGRHVDLDGAGVLPHAEGAFNSG